ncbi:hypothetical protein H8N03_06765 [Ramlibacter sp. USB13]|uniref:Uncharacterized protein n=1 Tax=Ramlibacter cellulosilyticus TaxID=2764187 RepID=A0A923MPT4_9BURK|nr:hypothetical protein [Ramlibacter cellulosilyticus]MBC5782641.1 hypothetical protein [Ramlibacter cellulosilyticus]
MRSENFFYEIQGKFKAASGAGDAGGGSDFQGRYMGHLLKAVGSRHPEVYRALSGQRGRWEGSLEFTYGRHGRRADLALTREGEDSPSVLVEIKAADGANATFNNQQLLDYADWARAEPGRKVLLLTHYPLPLSTQKELKGKACGGIVSHLRLTHLADQLRVASDRTGSSLLDLFLEYLEQQGLAMTRLTSTDILSLKTFLAFSFLPHIGHAGKMIKGERVANGASAFSLLVKNWQMLTAHITDAQGAAMNDAKKKLGRPGTKFRANPLYKADTPLTTTDESGDYWTYSRKLGGTWIIYTDCAIGKVGSQTVHLRYGLKLGIKKGTSTKREEAFDSNVYAAIWTSKRDLGWFDGENLRPGSGKGEALFEVYAAKLSDQTVLLRSLKSSIRKALGEAIKTAKKEDEGGMQKLLESVREPLTHF